MNKWTPRLLLLAAIIVTVIDLAINQSIIPLKYISYATFAATAITAIVQMVQNQQLKTENQDLKTTLEGYRHIPDKLEPQK